MSKKKNKNKSSFDQNFKLQPIGPETAGQKNLFDLYQQTSHLILTGYAGTGKTFCALYLTLDQLHRSDNNYQKLIIVRSAVPTRDQGYMPGNANDKMSVFEAPYQSMFTQLFGRSDAYQAYKQKNLLEVVSTSYIRGITLDNCLVIVDEVQNMNFHEIDSLVTRIGVDTRMILCGDVNQNDLQFKRNEHSGLSQFMHICHDIDLEYMDMVHFDERDIVRSGFVKEYIKAKHRYET